jgi:hypothetical protein
VSQVTPEDPSDWPAFVLDWPGAPTREWRLWRLWVRYRDAPIIGELQHVAQYGWMDTIYRPHWFPRLATTEEYEKTARGLDLMLLRIRRPGHPPGGGTSFESREVFERKLREAQGIVRRRVEGSLKKRAVARQMGIAPSTLYSYLKQYPGIWGGT